jgi:hypothetical protein
MGRVFLHPGEITSKRDGQRHFITASKLAQLYKVDLRKCFVVYNFERTIKHAYPPGQSKQDGDVHLYPLFSGNYDNYTPVTQ